MGCLTSGKLRLGRIGFLNVLPIYYPLESGAVSHDFDIVSGAPAYLNDLMARGELDVSVVSSIEYARRHDRYFLLPNLSIGCRGPVRSVLLLSRVPFERLSGRTVLVSTQSHTSVALLKILFSLRMGVEASFEEGSAGDALARGERPAAFLTIGDEALRLGNHPLYPYRLDLGEAWFDWTGLPFVFATWAIQRASVSKWSGRLPEAMGKLFAAKKWGRDNLDLICEQAARRGPLSRREFHDYYRGLNFDLKEEQQKGLELFFRFLVEIGEIASAPPPPEIFSLMACVA